MEINVPRMFTIDDNDVVNCHKKRRLCCPQACTAVLQVNLVRDSRDSAPHTGRTRSHYMAPVLLPELQTKSKVKTNTK